MADTPTWKQLDKWFRKGGATGLNNAANIIFAESQTLVPRNLGELAASGQSPALSDEHEATPDHLEARVTYGTPYAAAQHEGWALQERGDRFVLWTAKTYTTPGTGRKFLENPMMKMAGSNKLETIVGHAVQEELRKHLPEKPR